MILSVVGDLPVDGFGIEPRIARIGILPMRFLLCCAGYLGVPSRPVRARLSSRGAMTATFFDSWNTEIDESGQRKGVPDQLADVRTGDGFVGSRKST
jgi:hypothetical protein